MARYIDPLVFSLSAKSPEQLHELRVTYAGEARALRQRMAGCWLRNRVGVVIAACTFLGVASLGFVTSFREGQDAGFISWLVGLGWFFGAIYLGNRWRWFNDTAQQWRSEEHSLREALEMTESTLAQIERHLT